MKQLISRIDDDLHRRLKERASKEGRPVNDLVIEVLEKAVDDDVASLRRRLDRAGLRVIPRRQPGPPPSQPGPPPSMESVLRANRGTGTSVSDALRQERAAR